MSIDDLSKPLTADQIEFRIQSISKHGTANILVYKDARIDQHRLDEAVGPLGWKREHVNGNRNCIVSIWCDKKCQWVSKEDTGTESNTEAAKGLASDSFKRACFNWGIGRELYDYPHISVKLNGGSNKNSGSIEYYIDESRKDKWGNGSPKAAWGLKLKEWRWLTQFNDDGKLTFIAAKDQNGKLRYKSGEYKEKEAKA